MVRLTKDLVVSSISEIQDAASGEDFKSRGTKARTSQPRLRLELKLKRITELDVAALNSGIAQLEGLVTKLALFDCYIVMQMKKKTRLHRNSKKSVRCLSR